MSRSTTHKKRKTNLFHPLFLLCSSGAISTPNPSPTSPQISPFSLSEGEKKIQIPPTKSINCFFIDSWFGFEIVKNRVLKMDSGEIYRVSSARMNSSTIWRNSAMEVFSRSSRDENDEEALKWASIERLPTYLRVRRGILSLEGESAREIDVENLGFLEKRNVLERLVKIAEEDNERFLLKLKNRMER